MLYEIAMAGSFINTTLHVTPSTKDSWLVARDRAEDQIFKMFPSILSWV